MIQIFVQYVYDRKGREGEIFNNLYFSNNLCLSSIHKMLKKSKLSWLSPPKQFLFIFLELGRKIFFNLEP